MHDNYHEMNYPHVSDPVKFATKVSLLTVIFTLLWIALFRQPSEPDYRNDHIHDQFIEPAPTTTPWQPAPGVDQQELQDRMETTIPQLIESEHGVSSRKDPSLDQLCTAYDDICDKTSRDGSYTTKEQLYYQALVIYLIKLVDQWLPADLSVRDTLSHIKLYESEL